MSRLVSWPMYAIDPAAVAAFWGRLRRCLADQGFDDAPDALTLPVDLLAHWRDPALLLSQTCGFPLATSLAGAVRYVATPRFTAPGCAGAFYSSAVVVREDEPAQGMAALAGRRAAFNSRDSQSGYNSLLALVAPLATGGRFFGGTLETGAHRRSIDAVRSGAADLAAIDTVTLALVRDHAPDTVAGLRVLCHTASAPGLPFVTSLTTSDAEIGRLRDAVAAACAADAPEARALRLAGTEVLAPAAYAVIRTMRDEAVAAGYPDLA